MRWKQAVLLILILAALLCAATLIRPPQVNFTATFASPPTGAERTENAIYLFTDASAPGVCTGGGSSYALCAWNGSAWLAIGSGGGGSGGIVTSTVTVSNSQLLNLAATPVTLIPAQGTGTLVEVISMVMEYVYVSPAFSGGSGYSLVAQYGTSGANATQAEPEDLLFSSTADQMVILSGGGLSLAPSLGTLNTAVVLTAGGAITTGGGSLIVQLTYQVHSGFAGGSASLIWHLLTQPQLAGITQTQWDAITQ
jgi:hypothetical protein